MSAVYVARHARFVGVAQPGLPGEHCAERGCTQHTTDWRELPGSPANTHKVEATYVRTDLSQLAETRYRSEAHFVTYEVFDVATGLALPAQPRVGKTALPWLREQGFDLRTLCLAADVDTPGHAPWTAETRAEFEGLWAARPGPLATCGLYLSPKGYRLAQPLAEPLVVEAGERALRLWLQRLVEAGVWPSALEVKAWNSHFRTPHHLRQGARIESPWQDWSQCRAVEVEVPAEAPRYPTRKRSLNVAPHPVERFDELCPAGWEPVADVVGAAIRDTVTKDWRRCYLALAGALLERGCPAEGVPAVVTRAHLVDPQWEHLLHDRRTLATTTVTRWGHGLEISGASALRAGWPGVAKALDESTSNGSEAAVLRQLRGVERHITDLTEATSTLRREIRDAYGVVLIAGPPGLGKTEAVIAHAAGLAKIDGRAPAGSRIGLSAPTTALATEIQARATKAGVRTLRVFGPLSHRAENGTPTCIHSDAAAPLVGGGQSLERLFCAPERGTACEIASTCPARRGLDGDLDANLVVGPHELVATVAKYAGKAGTVVVDEPPPLVEVVTLRLADVEAAALELANFERGYALNIEPAMHALLAWAREAVPGAVLSAEEAVKAGAVGLPASVCVPGDATVPAGDRVLAMARAAVGGARSPAPPLTLVASIAVRRNVAKATVVGAASAACLAVWRAVQRPLEGLHPTRVRVLEQETGRVIAVVGANDRAVATLRRESPTVVLDAGAALIAPSVERIVGFAPRMVELDVGDGAPVERTVLATGRGTRKACFQADKVDADQVVPLLRAAFAWARENESTRGLVVISWGAIEAILLHALDDPGAAHALTRCKVSRKLAAQVKERLEDAVAPWRGRTRTAHYGGLRGLDHLRDADALVTVGDPRAKVDEEADRCAWLEVDADGRIDALAAAELDQAHGRLRLVHRDRPARALHVGGIVPAGWRGREVSVRRMATGRPTNTQCATMSARQLATMREAKCLTLRALGQRVGVSAMTMSRYESGDRAIPDSVAAAITAALSW